MEALYVFLPQYVNVYTSVSLIKEMDQLLLWRQ